MGMDKGGEGDFAIQILFSDNWLHFKVTITGNYDNKWHNPMHLFQISLQQIRTNVFCELKWWIRKKFDKTRALNALDIIDLVVNITV